MALFSKPITLDCSCYELGHCWTPYCLKATQDVAKSVFREALKIYGPLYLIAAFMKKRDFSYFKKKWIIETVRSSIFLTINGTMFVSFFCIWRKLAGCYYFYNTFLCGIPACTMSLLVERKDRAVFGRYYFFIPYLSTTCASILAIIVERKNRRGLLAVYLVNLALETGYRMAKHRGIVKPVKHGETSTGRSEERRERANFVPEVLLFSFASAIYFYFFRRKSNLPASTVSGLKFIVGSSELPADSATPVLGSNNNEEPPRFRTGVGIIDKMAAKIQMALKASPRHRTCRHQHGCALYVLRGFYRLFCLGYGIQTGGRLLSSMTRILRDPRQLTSALLNTDNVRLGLFLGTFSCIFRMVNCVLRWVRDRDSEVHGLVSGFLAGWSMMFYKSTPIALYTFTKMAEMMYFKGIDQGYLPYIKCADIIIYSVSTAFAFHAAVMEPHTLRPAYWRFLEKVTDFRFGKMNRKLLDIYGVDSSSLFPDYWPNYDPRFSNLKPPTS